jgi:hypothetical protein
MPTFAASQNNDGDDRRLIEKRQCGRRKPNEDAENSAFGAERQAEGMT